MYVRSGVQASLYVFSIYVRSDVQATLYMCPLYMYKVVCRPTTKSPFFSSFIQ